MWLTSKNNGKKIILKLSKGKDSDRIMRKRKKLKDTDLKLHEIKDQVYINDSLFVYYKMLLSKCKKLWINILIFGCSASNGSLKICVLKPFSLQVVSHIAVIERFFPVYSLLENIQQG